MESKTYINGIDIETLETYGDILVREFNYAEEEFRTRIRFNIEKYKHWVVWERRRRFFYYEGKKYYYNITCYRDKITNKKITYYHHKILRIIGKKNYLYEKVAKAYNETNWRRRSKNLNDIQSKKIPYDVIKYWLKMGYLKTTFYNTEIPETANILQVEFDDTFCKTQIDKSCSNLMIRMVGVHTKPEISNVKTLFLQMNLSRLSKEAREEKYEILNCGVVHFINSFTNLEELNLSGDGAKIIDKFFKDIRANWRYYDLYHFLKICSDNLNFSSRRNICNKRFYKKYFGNPYQILKDFLNRKLYDKVEPFLQKCLSHLRSIKAPIGNIRSLKQLIKLWKNNKTSIINSLDNENYLGGNAETFIGHYIKKSLKKPFATYSMETLKHLILCSVPRNVNVIFL